jgi:hypothetical protein
MENEKILNDEDQDLYEMIIFEEKEFVYSYSRY